MARTGGRVATVGVEAMSFHRPVYVGDLVSCHCRTERIGRTSIAVHVETWVRRTRSGRPPEDIRVTEGMFTYVALDDGGGKRAIERRDGSGAEIPALMERVRSRPRRPPFAPPLTEHGSRLPRLPPPTLALRTAPDVSRRIGGSRNHPRIRQWPKCSGSPLRTAIADANITRFAALVRERHGLDAVDYAALHRWSIEDRAAFWSALWDSRRGRRRARRRAGAGRRRPDAGREVVSRCAAQLRREPAPPPRRRARDPVPRRGSRPLRVQLPSAPGRGIHARSRRCARPGWKRATASPATCPTCPRRWSRCSPPRASGRSGRPPHRTSACRGVVDRFGQIAPKVLFSADGYFYGGKRFDSIDRLGAGVRPGSRRSSASSSCRTPRPTPDVSAVGESGDAGRIRHRPRPRGDRVRTPPLRPPALHHVLVGHHRRPEVHRARRRRHAAAARQGAGPAQRREARRSGSSTSRPAAG